MASQDYLIAIALIEQKHVRAMPLGGKEIKDNLDEAENFKKLGEEVILNLLLRVFQRSDEGELKRASEDKGLLLVHMHPKRMQKELPFIKSEWIRDGDTQQFLKYSDSSKLFLISLPPRGIALTRFCSIKAIAIR